MRLTEYISTIIDVDEHRSDYTGGIYNTRGECALLTTVKPKSFMARREGMTRVHIGGVWGNAEHKGKGKTG